MINSVAVVGCGWFGLPLAKVLVDQGYRVHGSKRSVEQADGLASMGINGFALDLNDANAVSPHKDVVSLLHTDAMVINIPPGLRRGDSDYLARLRSLKSLMGAHRYQRIIFVSTTGVYPLSSAVQCEGDAYAYNESSKILLAAEQMFAAENCVVVRFAGLVGPKRHPGRFLAGKQGVAGGNLSVNLTHLDDCVGAVLTLLRHSGAVSPVYNVCAERHPNKAEFYTEAAIRLGLEAPTFIDEALTENKLINGQLITEELGYQYHYRDPLAMLVHCG